jgi:cytochrome b561
MKIKNYSAVYRIIHWSIAICMVLLLITIFLRLTWMNKNNVAEIIQNYLNTTDQSLTQDQLIVLAKKIRQPMWDWHLYLGYVLTGLFSIRFLLPLIGEMKFQNPFKKELILKEKFQNFIYLIFYGCVVISLSTGLLIIFGPATIKKSMEAIHVLSIYYLVAFLILHIGGVLLSDFTNQKGIVSKIISGNKQDR